MIVIGRDLGEDRTRPVVGKLLQLAVQAPEQLGEDALVLGGYHRPLRCLSSHG